MILLVGGSGFLGRGLAQRFQAEGRPTRIVCRNHPSNLDAGDQGCFLCDIAELPDRPDIFQGVETVIHLVHSTKPACSMRDIPHDIVSNLPTSVRLMQAAQDHGVRRMIFISSGGTVYGVPRYLPMDENHPTNPICSYGITKLAIEKYLGLFAALNPGFTGITLRLSNPYGPWQQTDTGQGVIAHFLHRIRQGLPVEIWGDGEVVRDFIHIDDVLRAVSAVLDADLGSDVFNLGSEQGASLNDIVSAMSQVMGHDIPVTHKPGRPIDIPRVVLSTAKLRHALDWRPEIPLADGIARVWDRLTHHA